MTFPLAPALAILVGLVLFFGTDGKPSRVGEILLFVGFFFLVAVFTPGTP